MGRYRHLFHRSEYQIALHNYRRARRRGDAAAASHWLKTADMHLRVADRFHAGVYTSMVREKEIAAERTNEVQKPDAKVDIFAQRRQLDDLERRMKTDLAEEARRESQSDEETTRDW